MNEDQQNCKSLLRRISEFIGSLSIRTVIIVSFALPMTTNLLLLNVFFNANKSIQKSHDWAVHSKEITAFTKYLDLHLLELNKTLGQAFLLKDQRPPEENIFFRLLDHLEEKTDNLKAFTKGSSTSQNTLNKVKPLILEIKSLERIPSSIAKAEDLMFSLGELISDFTERENKLDKKRDKRADYTINREFNLLLWVLAFNILFYAVIAYVLRESFFKSLRRIVHNLNTAKSGEKLTEPALLKSELSILENEFYGLYKKLEEKRLENEGFVYCVSHDLKSPLLNIKSFANELSKSTLELETKLNSSYETIDSSVQNLISENKESLSFILSSASKISQIITSVLSLSKAGRIPIHMENLDLGLKIRQTLDAIEFEIRAAGAEVLLKPLPRINSDRAVVNQIFLNLITNAIKYREPSRNLQIEIGQQLDKSNSEFVAIYIKDNGLGIAPNYLERIFLPFEQIKKLNIPGEGLGLSIVKRLLERTGGQVEVESLEGVGTTFTVYFLCEK